MCCIKAEEGSAVNNLKKQGRLMVAEDISALGDLSMTVALPLLMMQGVSTASLPTSILSTQSEGFGKPVSLSVSKWLPRTLQHWKNQQVEIKGALIGYIEDTQIGEELVSFLAQNKLPFVFIDPVFADRGILYPALSEKQLKITQQLIEQADIITPNYTEARFLVEANSKVGLGEQKVFTEFELLKKLEKMMQKEGKAVITGVEEAKKIGCIWLNENGQMMKRMFPRLSDHFYGSGDVFAALLAGFLWCGKSFSSSVSEATLLTYQALKHTADTKREKRYGVDISTVMQKLAQKSAK